MEGRGQITYPDGSVYEGGMLGDLRAAQELAVCEALDG